MNKKINKKILAIFLSLTILFSGALLFPSKKAEAQSFGDIAGKVGKVLGTGIGLVAACQGFVELKGVVDNVKDKLIDSGKDAVKNKIKSGLGIGSSLTGVPVVDQKLKDQVEEESKEQQKKDEEINCLQLMKKFVLSSIKQRLIDKLTEQTVRWVQGDGQPQFLTRPGDFLTDSVRETSLRSTLQELGLSQLCSSSLRNKILIEIEQPSFRQQLDCTLSEVLGNTEETLQNFRDDFNQGGWIAYREVLKPQNNEWGLRVITKNELFKKEAEKRDESRQEAAIGRGFLSEKRCLEWREKSSGQSNGPQNAPGIISESDAGYNNYTSSPDGASYNGRTDYPQGSNWYCAESQVVTPGSVVAGAVDKVVGAPFDRINAAEDLTEFVTIVTNSIINELTKDLISGKTPGILNAHKNEQGNVELNQSNTDCSQIEDSRLRSLCQDTQSSEDSSSSVENARSSVQNILNLAEQRLLEIESILSEASFKNSNLISTLKDLIQCQQSTGGDIVNENASSDLDEAQRNPDTINDLKSDMDNLLLSIDDLKSRVSGASESEITTLSSVAGSILDRANDLNGTTSSFLSDIESSLSSAENDLIKCNGGELSNQVDINTGFSHTLSVGSVHNHSGATVSNPNGGIRSYNWSFTFCPSSSCPSLRDASGLVINREKIDRIPGPSFIPNERGNYELTLTVIDVDGNSFSNKIIESAE